MPIYEYKCDNEHTFDIMQRISDDPLTSCIECGAPVRKLLHPVGISFKGSGFYSTDYKNGSRKEKSESTLKNGFEKKTDPAEKKSEASGAKTSEKKS